MSSEISEKTILKIPIPLAIVVCGGLLSFGSVYFKLEDGLNEVNMLKEKLETVKQVDEKRVDKLEKELKEFFQAEIDGLRGDWERRYKDNVDRRLTNLENEK